jgi:hypothetical protein
MFFLNQINFKFLMDFENSLNLQELNLNRDISASRCRSARRNGMHNIEEGINQQLLISLKFEFFKQKEQAKNDKQITENSKEKRSN